MWVGVGCTCRAHRCRAGCTWCPTGMPRACFCHPSHMESNACSASTNPNPAALLEDLPISSLVAALLGARDSTVVAFGMQVGIVPERSCVVHCLLAGEVARWRHHVRHVQRRMQRRPARPLVAEPAHIVAASTCTTFPPCSVPCVADGGGADGEAARHLLPVLPQGGGGARHRPAGRCAALPSAPRGQQVRSSSSSSRQGQGSAVGRRRAAGLPGSGQGWRRQRGRRHAHAGGRHAAACCGGQGAPLQCTLLHRLHRPHSG